MTKVFVFDTNSLISAHLLPSSTVRKAFDGILVHSKETFSEFLEVFTRPKFDKYISLDERMSAINQIELKSQLIALMSQLLLAVTPRTTNFWRWL